VPDQTRTGPRGALTAGRTAAVSRIVDKGDILHVASLQPFRDMDENGLFALTLEPYIVTL
jgi:hypothetical protein